MDENKRKKKKKREKNDIFRGNAKSMLSAEKAEDELLKLKKQKGSQKLIGAKPKTKSSKRLEIALATNSLKVKLAKR